MCKLRLDRNNAEKPVCELQRQLIEVRRPNAHNECRRRAN